MTDSELTRFLVAYLSGLTTILICIAGYIFFTRKKVKPRPLAVLWRVK